MGRVILVAGVLANKYRNGGEAWVRLSWMRGLQRLGCDVRFVEQIDEQVCTDDHGREVDLHPVRFDQRGFGIQQGLRPGEQFHYPPDAFATGVISGRQVACLSVEQQLRFHSSYELRDRDRQDLANLHAALGGS